MPPNMRVHLAAAGLLALIATVIVVFWAYPRLLVYLLLAIVAVLAYGALYLVLAAWMDPKKVDASQRPASPSEPARVEAPAPPEERPKRAKKARKKRATKPRTKRKARRETET